MTVIALPPPASPIYSKCYAEQQRGFDNLAEAMAAEPDPLRRALVLIHPLSRAVADWCREKMPVRRQAVIATALVSGALECLGAKSIDHPAMAVVYLLSAHPSWRSAAQQFLNSRRSIEYLKNHRMLCEFIEMLRHLIDGVGVG